MTAEAESIKSLKQVENKDPVGTGLTSKKTQQANLHNLIDVT